MGWDAGIVLEAHLTAFLSDYYFLVTGLGTPNFKKLEALVVPVRSFLLRLSVDIIIMT